MDKTKNQNQFLFKRGFQNFAGHVACVVVMLSSLLFPKLVYSEDALLKLNLVSACTIYSDAGKIMRSFPGFICLYMSDGNVISADDDRLAMIRPDHSEAWRIPGHFHHQLNWSNDRRHVLAMSSKVVEIDKKRVRLDVLMKVDLKGRVVFSVDSQQILEQLKMKVDLMQMNWAPKLKSPAEFEVTHFNSFYEVPKLKRLASYYSKNIREGDHIIGSFRLGAFVISQDLKVARTFITFPSSKFNSVHDVQVLDDGGILFFNNERKDDSSLGPNSSIEVLRKDNVVETVFVSNPPQAFYSPRTGAAQILSPDLVLFSHYVQGYFIWDHKKKKLFRSGLLEDSLFVRGIRPLQQIKAEDLSDFLKAWP